MQIALIGFSKSGKTTIFNALTGASAEVSAYSASAKTHRAAVVVPDPRLDQLNALFESKKLVHASIDYVDPVGIRRDQVGEGAALGDDMLNTISTADALLAVVRGFEDDSGVACDAEGDFDAIWLELVLSDLAKVDNRLERVEAQAQRIAGEQRKTLEEEGAVLRRLKEALEANLPVRSLDFNPDEDRILRSFQFITMKPLLVVLNTADAPDADTEKLLQQMRESVGDGKEIPGFHCIALCGQTEMEIAQLDPEDREEFMEEYGIAEAAMMRVIQTSYEVLGLLSFLTVGPTEAHAWTLRRGLPAVDAAGVIHSDLQRGFIRAQVINWQDLVDVKTFAEAKKQGLLRMEGKEYVVQDGDVIEVFFSV